MRGTATIGNLLHRFGRRTGVITTAGAALALSVLVAPSAATAHPLRPIPPVPPAPAPAPGSVVISSSGSGSANVGRVLVDSNGFSLYDFTGDQFEAVTGCLPTNVSPTGTPCTTVWQPVMATGPLVAQNGVNPRLLGTENRTGIGNQVTYAGEPLYRFSQDHAAGQTNGQDVTSFLGFWRLVSVFGGPAVDRHPAVNLELTSAGPVLDTPTNGATRSLYVLSADPARQTTCTGECAAIWPPLLTSREALAGPGTDQGALGVLRRPDGTFQVTYHGKPVYLFALDLGAGAPSGQTNGDNFVDPPAFGVWDTLAPAGTVSPGPITVTAETSGGSTILAADGNSTPGGAASATLYTFSADSPTGSACNGACANAWPPVLTSAPPIAGPGVDASQLGTIQRTDGTFQVTYAGKPLYLFSKALDTTTTGDGIMAFGGQFHVVPATGAS